MSNNIDKDIEMLEKIKQGIKADIKAPNVTVRNIAEKKVQAIETVLQSLENSVSKDVIREKIEELKEKLKYYDKSNFLEQINANKIEAKIQVLEELLYKEDKQ